MLKFLIIALSTSIGIAIGLFSLKRKSIPNSIKILSLLLLIFYAIIAVIPHSAIETHLEGVYYSKMIEGLEFPVYVDVIKTSEKDLQICFLGNLNKKYDMQVNSEQIPENGLSVLKVKYISEKKAYGFISTEAVKPLIIIPYLPHLANDIKIFNFHVPFAWVSVLAYFVSMIFSIKYLRSKEYGNDILAGASATIGTFFCLIALFSGMYWAKLSWGSYWNWDPRETSILILLLIYGAYFALRSSIPSDFLRAKLSAVYSIIAFITVPFLVFILPRITSSLHPGSGNEDNIGPVLSSNSQMLNDTMLVIFAIGMTTCTILYFLLLQWLANGKRKELSLD